MSNLIQQELQAARSKMLATIAGTDLVELSINNVAIVEAMIQNDAAYLKSSDITAAPKDNSKGGMTHGGSTAYWMSELKTILIDGKSSSSEYKDVIAGAIAAVDRENSTHLNSDGIGREELTDRIISIKYQDLIIILKSQINRILN